jgi:hypothetical protein
MVQGGTREQSRQGDGSHLRSRPRERIGITARFTREWSERLSFGKVRDVKFAKIVFLAAGVWGIVLFIMAFAKTPVSSGFRVVDGC